MNEPESIIVDVGPIEIYISPFQCINLVQHDYALDQEDSIHLCSLDEWNKVDQAVRKAYSGETDIHNTEETSASRNE